MWKVNPVRCGWTGLAVGLVIYRKPSSSGFSFWKDAGDRLLSLSSGRVCSCWAGLSKTHKELQTLGDLSGCVWTRSDSGFRGRRDSALATHSPAFAASLEPQTLGPVVSCCVRLQQACMVVSGGPEAGTYPQALTGQS